MRSAPAQRKATAITIVPRRCSAYGLQHDPPLKKVSLKRANSAFHLRVCQSEQNCRREALYLPWVAPHQSWLDWQMWFAGARPLSQQSFDSSLHGADTGSIARSSELTRSNPSQTLHPAIFVPCFTSTTSPLQARGTLLRCKINSCDRRRLMLFLHSACTADLC